MAVVRRMAADLSFPVNIVARPTLRESDGLALSSRNVFLRPEDRPGALLISKVLFGASDMAERGQRSAAV